MRRGLERERRIVLTVVVLVGVPGIVLSLVGFRTIEKEQAEVERQVASHYESLAAEVDAEVDRSLAFHAESVRDLAARLAAGIRSPAEAVEIVASRIENEPIYARFYLISPDGRLLHPSVGQAADRIEVVGDENHPALATALELEFARKDAPAAIREYRRLLAAEPGDEGLACLATVGLARCLARTGRSEEAIDALRQVVRRFPLLADRAGMVYSLGARLELAHLLEASGQAVAAAWARIEILEFLVGHGPDLPPGQVDYYRARSLAALEPLRSIPPALRSPEDGALLERWARVEEEGAIADALRRDRADFEALLAEGLRGWLTRQAETPDRPLSVGDRLLVPAWLRTDVDAVPMGALVIELDRAAILERLVAPLLERASGPEVALRLVAPSDEPAAAGDGPVLAEFDLAGLPPHRLRVERTAAAGASTTLSGSLLLWTVVLSTGCILAGLYVTLRTVRREVRSARIKTDFVSSVTHELKTPLTAIQIFVETLRLDRVDGPAERARYLDLLSHESLSLSRLIGRILDFSKMEEGSKGYRFEPTNLAEVLDRAVALFRTPLVGDDDRVDLDVPDDIAPIIADAQALEEIVWNLLDNARKYSPAGTPIRLAARVGPDGARIQVADRGVGIPARSRQRIFEKFYRVRDDRTRSIEGTGLGLAIVRHIVRAHGGRIEVDSQPGIGSTFTIDLPLEGPDPPPAW